MNYNKAQNSIALTNLARGLTYFKAFFSRYKQWKQSWIVPRKIIYIPRVMLLFGCPLYCSTADGWRSVTRANARKLRERTLRKKLYLQKHELPSFLSIVSSAKKSLEGAFERTFIVYCLDSRRLHAPTISQTFNQEEDRLAQLEPNQVYNWG